ncbi:MAG: hypothetical protein EXS13_07725 [Planctomycetes bacterium]|nr:hypothetical protein [Planctomycetota bacterium]
MAKTMTCHELEGIGWGAVDDGARAVDEAKAIAAHLAGCAACRTEAAAMAALVSQLAAEVSETPNPVAEGQENGSAGQRRFAQLLEAWRIGQTERPSPWRAWPVAAALLVGLSLGVVSPWHAGGSTAPDASAPASVSGRQFLLALHERPGSMASTPEEEQRLVAEYGDWAGELARGDQLVAAEKLRDETELVLRRDGDGIVVTAPGPEDATPRAERLLRRACRRHRAGHRDRTRVAAPAARRDD